MQRNPSCFNLLYETERIHSHYDVTPCLDPLSHPVLQHIAYVRYCTALLNPVLGDSVRSEMKAKLAKLLIPAADMPDSVSSHTFIVTQAPTKPPFACL